MAHSDVNTLLIWFSCLSHNDRVKYLKKKKKSKEIKGLGDGQKEDWLKLTRQVFSKEKKEM